MDLKMAITNYLSPVEFEVSIKRLPAVTFFVNRFTMPGISAGSVMQPNVFNPVFHTADRLDYGELMLTFLVDERMNNYLEIHDWLIGMTFPKSFDQYATLRDSEEGLYSDITLLIKNSKKNPNIQVNFLNAFPTTLSEIQLDTTVGDVVYPEVTVSFRYDSYSISRI